MDNETNESQLNKIRGLLAKAESTDFPHEAETYTAKAMALMAKWGIEEALLEDAKPKSEIADKVFDLLAPFARDKVRLLFQVVKALGGDAVLISGFNQPGQKRLHVFATQTDMARIDMLFTSLLVQCSTAMNYAVSVSAEARAFPRKFKSDFLYGFSDQVGYRLRNMEREATQAAESAAVAQGTSTALVLASKQDRVRARLEDAYKSLTAGRASNRQVGGGYGHGSDAGKRANIGQKTTRQGALVG